jgi:hypothetical protein
MHLILVKNGSMMQTKRLIILVVLIVISCSLVTAQAIIKSFPERISGKFTDLDILGKNSMGILVHHYGGGDHAIGVYNDNLRLLSRHNLNLKEKKAVLEELLPTSNQILAFYTQIESGFIYLKAKKISSNFEISVNAITLDSIARASWDGPKPFYIRPSADNSRIMVFYILSGKSRNIEIKANIFDADLNFLNTVTFSTEGREDMFLRSIRISNQGNIIAVVSHLSRRVDISEFFNVDKFTVFNYSSGENTLRTYTIGEEDYLYKDVVTGVDHESGHFYLAACYQHRKNRDDIGLLAHRTATTALQESKKIPFSEDMIAQSQSFGFKNWYEKAEIIRPRRIIPRSDGGFMLIAETEYKFTRVVRSQPVTYSMYGEQSLRYYDQNHYYDIIAYSFSPGVSLEWKADLPKAQISEGDGGLYSSYALFQANNVLKFLFNENITQSGNFMEYNINPKGMVVRNSLFNAEKESMMLIPQKSRQLPGNMMIIPAENRKAIQFVLIKY